MNKKQLNIAKEALYQSEMIRIKQIEALSDIGFPNSEKYEKFKEELRVKIRSNALKSKSLSRKQKISLIVAAAVIFTLIATACAFGKQIKGFFVQLFDSCASFEYIEYASNSYEDYKLTYIPENYIECREAIYMNAVQTIYFDNEMPMIFIRFPESQFYTLVDTKKMEYETIILNETKIYYNEKNNEYSIYWVHEDATLYLKCSTDIEWEEIEKMILSVRCE